MIAVTAASGAYGRLVVAGLRPLSRAGSVVAVVRAPERAGYLAAEGVEVRRGDYDDPGSLRTAFKGVDRLLLVSSPELDPARRILQHRTALDAARDAGVGHVVYTSFLGAGTRPEGVTAAHHATERALSDSGLPHTVLRHPFYSEAFLHAGLRDAVASGELPHGTGGRGLNTAFRADLAEAAVHVLTEEQHLGRAHDFTGTPWTYPELAEVLTAVSGTPVVARERTEPAPGAHGWLEGQVRAGELELRTDDLAQVLGRPPVALGEAVSALLA
ncbi:NAD(P)H-binding protein [Streptomyces sp. S9]|nr:NAD(P)H-binding protein [Streptomyces sp. S9]